MSARRLLWQPLPLTTPLDAARVEAVFTNLYALSGSPFIVLEARGADEQVRWRLGTDTTDAARVRDVLQAHLPALDLLARETRVADADVAARLWFAGSERRPLAAGAPETATRTILGALARARRAESVTLQVTLGPRLRPQVATSSPRREAPAASDKVRRPRSRVDIRVGAVSADASRSRSLISGVVASLRALDVPGVRLTAVNASANGMVNASLPWFWRSALSPQELTALAAWPIGEPPLPGVPLPHPRRLPPAASIPRRGLVLGHAVGDAERPIAIALPDLPRALHLIGPPGVGKTNLLASCAIQEAAAGRGVIVIDPKGDLVDLVLERLAPERHDDVVVLDPRDAAPVGIGALTGDPDRTADGLLAVFRALYPNNFGIRSSDILNGALLTLARRGDASLVMIPTLLTNVGVRRSITARLVREDPLGLGAFWAWFEGLSEPERQQAIAPVLSKLRPILNRPDMRHTLGQPRPRFALGDVFTKRRILLVNLAKGQLGPEAAALLGSVLVSLLRDAVMARASVPAAERSPVLFAIDEFQDYVHFGDEGGIGDALAQFRGLGASLAISHQHLSQLPPTLRDGVLANARSRVMFGLGHRDASEFARMSRGAVEAVDLELLPAFEAYASLFVAGGSAPWVSLKTEPLGPPITDAAVLRERSSARYGVSGEATDEYLRGLIEPPAPASERFGRTPKKPSGGTS